MCQPTLWSQDKLDRSILRVLEGDEGEETHLSGTSGTGINKKGTRKTLNHIVEKIMIYL